MRLILPFSNWFSFEKLFFTIFLGNGKNMHKQKNLLKQIFINSIYKFHVKYFLYEIKVDEIHKWYFN